jgi:hypothetical protein
VSWRPPYPVDMSAEHADPHVLGPDTAPTPFTADQIRAACPSGRVGVFRVTESDGTVSHRLYRFVDADAERVRFGGGPCDPSGEPLGELRDRECSWVELQGHASYPAAATRIEDDEVDLPTGLLACLRYTVEDGDEVSTIWFARLIPGPPVKVVETVAGQVSQTTELVLHRPGPDQSS